MNRRGFLAALFAAPAAAIAGLRERPRFDRVWAMLDHYKQWKAVSDYTKTVQRPTATGITAVLEDEALREWRAVNHTRTLTTKQWAGAVNKATGEAFSK